MQACHIDRPALNRQLRDVILNRRKSDPGVVCHNQGGWHSERDLLSWGELPIQVLLAIVSKNAPTDMELVLAWANVNEAGDFNAPHVHTGRDFVTSGYYVVVGDSGDTVFEPEEYRVEPMPGLLAFFPYDHTHRVEPCNEQRITIAFNFARLRAATKE